MNCANHPDTPAVSFCRNCGKPLCQACQRSAMGTIFCEEHYAAHVAAQQQPSSPYSSPYTAPPSGTASPGLAFVLGLIPGVGAIYNGQYAKGLVHVVILGILISIISTGSAHGLEPLLGMLIGLWVIYMPFEAYHTALRRQRGEAVDEFSSLAPLRQEGGGIPLAPIVLIVTGVVFLLNNLDIVRLYQLLRYWPVFLILIGVYLLWARMGGGPGATTNGTSNLYPPPPPPAPVPEVTHER